MSVITDYLETVPVAQKAELVKIYEIVKRVVPEAEESISYGMPAFKYKGKPLVYFSAFKNHMSLFPTAGPSEILKDRLVGYKISKGTIQFTVDKPLPEPVIEEIVRIRMAAIES